MVELEDLKEKEKESGELVEVKVKIEKLVVQAYNHGFADGKDQGYDEALAEAESEEDGDIHGDIYEEGVQEGRAQISDESKPKGDKDAP